MSAEDLRGFWGETQRLKAKARADQRRTSVPLIVFGGLVVLLGLVTYNASLFPRTLYWLVAGPMGLVAIAVWYRRHAKQIGAGPARGPYGKTALALVLLLVAVPMVFLMPTPAVALMLLIVAWRQANRYLAIWALILGVVGGLEDVYFFDNRLYELAHWLGWFPGQYGYFTGAPAIVYGLLGLAMTYAGLRARRKERT